MLSSSMEQRFNALETRVAQDRQRDEVSRLADKLSKSSLGPKEKPTPMDVDRSAPQRPAQPSRPPGRQDVPDIPMSDIPQAVNPIIASQQRSQSATMSTQTVTDGLNKRTRPRQASSTYEPPRKYGNLGGGDVAYRVTPPAFNDYVMVGNNVSLLHQGAVGDFQNTSRRKRMTPNVFRDFLSRQQQ